MSSNVASDLPTIEEVKRFTAEELNEFLKKRLSDIDNHLDTLKDKEVDGEAFLTFTYESISYSGISLGASLKIMKFLNDIQRATFQSTSVEKLTYGFGQMNLSGGPVGANTTILTELMQVVKENSAIMKEYSAIMEENSAIMAESSAIMAENSAIMKEYSAIMKENSAIMKEISKRILGILIQIEKREIVNLSCQRQHNYFLAETNSYLEDLPNSVSTYIQNNPMTQTMTEKQVQNWFKNVMTRLSSNWKNRMVFRETNDTPYLDGYKPDISIFNIDDILNDAFNTIVVQTILELKKHKRTIGFSDEEKGQLVDYLHILIEQQPLRRFFAVFLSDGTYLYVIAFDRNTSQYQEYQTDFITGLRLFHTLIYRNSGYITICGPTSIDLVIPVTSSRTRTTKIHLERFLGEGTTSKVYKINWNGSPAAVKISSDVNNVKHEAEMLRGLNTRSFTNVPILIANDDNHLVTRPVCKQFRYSNDFINNFRAQHCKELLNLLRRIHSNGLYHRDVRPSNIMLDTESNSLVLVDWGSAVYNPSNMVVPYKGTTTYASPSILNNDMGNYIPKPADDLHSFVRTMYVFRNPHKKPELASTSTQAIKDYWHRELNGLILWKEMLSAVDNNQIDILEKICEVFPL